MSYIYTHYSTQCTRTKLDYTQGNVHLNLKRNPTTHFKKKNEQHKVKKTRFLKLYGVFFLQLIF